jgi:hypothetical protein
MKSKKEIEYWLFSSYKDENDYNNNHPFFEKEFTDFSKMKTFSAKHDLLNTKEYPHYCSNYKKINSLNKQDNEN